MKKILLRVVLPLAVVAVAFAGVSVWNKYYDRRMPNFSRLCEF